MKVIRIGNNRNVNQEVNRVQIELGGVKYTITETVDGKVSVLSHDDEILIFPCTTNSISFK